MGKPLSRPDCLRQSPRCLGKADEDEAYIEDCYVPQRSIYDTMRINEQIDQGARPGPPPRGTLGSGGGEGSTISSNGTIGADLGAIFVSRAPEHAGGGKKLDERVIFDALKLTGDPQVLPPPVGLAGPGLEGGAKRRHQGGDRRDNPNRRSWKAFMPPSFPEFAERLELSSAERRLSGAGSPPPAPPACSTPYTPSPLSSTPHTPTAPTPPVLTPPQPISRQKQAVPAVRRGQTCAPPAWGGQAQPPQHSPAAGGGQEGGAPTGCRLLQSRRPPPPLRRPSGPPTRRGTPRFLSRTRGTAPRSSPPRPSSAPPPRRAPGPAARPPESAPPGA
ncbi:uncharacterized protein ACNS7B_013868 [Menidia menidia]